MELFLAGLDRLMGDRTSGDATPTDSVGYWRRRVLDVAVTVGLILGAISVVPGVIRAALEANYVLLVADVTVLGIAVFVLLGRRIPYRLRAGLLVFAAFAIGLVQLVTSGLDTPAPLWLFAAPVMAAILFDLWTALALVGLVGVTMLGQLVLGRVGLLPAGLAGAVGSPRWVEVATDLVLLATVVPLFVGVLLEGLRTSFDRVRRVTDDLKAEGSRLLRVNRELEQEVMRRRQAEEERAWLTTAMEQAADAVAILELDGRIRYVNRSFVRMFGRDRLDLVGADIERVGLFSDHDTAARVMGTLDRGEVWVGRLAAERAGTTWHAQASFSTLRDQAGQPSHRLAVIRDVSREAELELQLQQAQKMKAMGTFAGGIAHDFNNLLVPILGTAELLAGQADGEVRDQLADIARSARRGRELVAQILAFSRGGRRRGDTVCLAGVVEDSERLLRASLPANIELELAVLDRGPVHVSEAEAQQVLMNLCTNAFHAMRRDGGTLSVTVDCIAGRDVATRNGVVAAPPATAQDYVRLTVADTGEGMEPATMDRVFEPFFTTKPDGEGTGLGLAMVHSVVSGAGGTLVMRSRKGRGTTVEVLLPRGIPPETSDGEPVVVRQGAGQQVLVVDDEQSVRTIVARFLERLGYRPRAAEPDVAEGILASDAELDLLITDLSMPQVNGLELGRRARTLRPSLPMILSTGLVDRDTIRQARAAGFTRVLAKPFELGEFAGALSEVLGGGEPGPGAPVGVAAERPGNGNGGPAPDG